MWDVSRRVACRPARRRPGPGAEEGHGMIIFFVAVAVLPVSLLFAGLAIDLGALGVLRDRLQVAADAGAVAGASSIAWTKADHSCLTNCAGSWSLNLDVPKAYSALNGAPDPDVTFTPTLTAP